MIPLFEPVVPVFDAHGDCIARIEYDNDPFEPYVVHVIGDSKPAPRYGTLIQAERWARKRWAINHAPIEMPLPTSPREPEGAQEPTTTEASTDSTTSPSEGLETIQFADGFEDAFMGIGTQFNRMVAIYDLSKCKNILIKRGMSPDAALEYLEYNVLGAYVGTQTPIFVDLMSDEQARERLKEW